MTPPEREYTRLEGFAFFVVMIGVQLSSELFSQWGMQFYSPPVGTGRTVYVAIGIVAYAFIIGRMIDLIADLMVGVWSDRTARVRGRWAPAGRRRPFLFWGSILMTGTMILFWYPPVAGESRMNFVFCTAIFALHWIFFTFAYIPLLGMAPEIARSRKSRVRLGTWIAAGMSIGLSLAAILPGVLIEALDPAQQGGAEGHSAVGYQRVAIIFALASLFCFQFFVWTVREREATRNEVAVGAPWKDILGAFRNRLFLLYFAIFFLYYVGVLGVQRVVPQWAQLGLGGSEATVSVLGLPFVITCLGMALLCPLLNRVLDLKWILVIALACGAVASPLMYPIAIMNAESQTKIILGAVLFGISGIGTGITYVLMTPLLGHIIDQHAESDGIKREALFNGLHNVMYKLALVGGIWVAATSMNTLGNSVDRPLGVLVLGPIGGAFCLAALILGLFYPKSGRGPEALKE